ncbi:LptF/LptG family permease [Polaribacter sejongensis]|uniref:LptF/LptG family permease n=1 Tax=Polaribacter sejongensis TaxID=985043 RepID=UPI0035A58999
MKILDRYILKTFLVPFIATFLIVLFVLVMQVLWQTFENIAGKGISLPFILKFLYYSTLIITPQALPIGVLLSSIMALGTLGENYEFAAAKSAGISLQRLVRPLVFLTLILSGVNFLFLNNIYPYAVLKQKNLYLNIKKKQPALALVPGSFNSDLPGFQIKFDEKFDEEGKDGKEVSLLKKVLIYDLTAGKGNQKVITAESGKIISEEGSRYMTFILYDGYYYQEHVKTAKTNLQRKKMAASNATFKEYEFNIDISSVTGDDDLSKTDHTKNFMMLSLNQLSDTIPDLKASYDEALLLKSKNLYSTVVARDLYQYPDSLKTENIDIDVLENFDLQSKINILNSATTKTERTLSSIKNGQSSIKYKRKI